MERIFKIFFPQLKRHFNDQFCNGKGMKITYTYLLFFDLHGYNINVYLYTNVQQIHIRFL